jgi:hypothetical protein
LPSEGKGHTFESCRVRQFLKGFTEFCGPRRTWCHQGVTNKQDSNFRIFFLWAQEVAFRQQLIG